MTETRGKTVDRENRHGMMIRRCVSCNKTAYGTEREADGAVAMLFGRGVKSRAYLGPCGWWHLTTQPMRARRP